VKPFRSSALDELAFAGRNREYGAYDLRLRYRKYLLISTLIGIALVILIVMIPFLINLISPAPIIDMDLMYDVEYYSMMPPPDEDLNKLVMALAKPLQETPRAPVVTDSIPPEEEKPVPEPPKLERPEDIPPGDSTGTSDLGAPNGEPGGAEGGVSSNVDVYPRFPGGDEARLFFLRKNVRYPEPAIRNKIQGVVLLVFVIETDGSVSNIRVSKGIGGGCDEESVRVTRIMPPWEPGKRNGKAVRVLVRMPIVFRIPGG
jgi:protein TonB